MPPKSKKKCSKQSKLLPYYLRNGPKNITEMEENTCSATDQMGKENANMAASSSELNKDTQITKSSTLSEELSKLEKMIVGMENRLKKDNADNKVEILQMFNAGTLEIKKAIGELQDQVKEHDKAIRFQDKEIESNKNYTKQIKNELDGKISEMKKDAIRSGIHNRKRNLLFYGIPLQGSLDKEDTETVVRNILQDKLKLEKTLVDKMTFTACHRLQPRKDSAPPAIIIVVHMLKDRQLIFNSTKNIPKDSQITVRQDLPVELKIKRSKLAKLAFTLRKDKNFQTRIKLYDVELKLEVRKNKMDSWKEYKKED